MIEISPSILNAHSKSERLKGNSNQTELKKEHTFQKRQRETLKVTEERLKVRRAHKYRKNYMKIFE